jgi:hypothetical protein
MDGVVSRRTSLSKGFRYDSTDSLYDIVYAQICLAVLKHSGFCISGLDLLALTLDVSSRDDVMLFLLQRYAFVLKSGGCNCIFTYLLSTRLIGIVGILGMQPGFLY